MQYWRRWETGLRVPSLGGNSEKFLLFDFDQAGLNNMRIAWEVAGVIALETSRTLVLPPPKGFYLIDLGADYIEYPEPGHKSRLEDFINMEQLRRGLGVKTFQEFAESQSGSSVSESSALSVYNRSLTRARSVHGAESDLCDLAHWRADDRLVYAQMVSFEDGRLFSCSRWFDEGQMHLQDSGEPWVPSWEAISLLHGGFVWHADVFEMASLIVEDLGIFGYVALHARYGDFALQFDGDTESPSKIIDTWFASAAGRRLMHRAPKVYVSTDDTSGNVTDAFHRKGITAKSSLDYWQAKGSPISELMEKWGPVRVQQLKGPVEQVVCAFGRIFVGSAHSTFSGYINQIRFNADAPQTKPLYHTEAPSEEVLSEVEHALEQWEARSGATRWAAPSLEEASAQQRAGDGQ